VKILLLEDGVCAESLKGFLSDCSVEVVNNLLDFDCLLYEEPGVQAYGLVLMDLQIDMPYIGPQELIECIPEMKGFEQNTVFGLHLLGLDYLHSKVLNHPITKGCVKEKFYLISGHAQLLKRKKIFETRQIDFSLEHLLDKGQEDYAELLKRLVNKLRPTPEETR